MEYEEVWKKLLSPNEKVKYEFSISKKYRVFCATLGSLAGVALLMVPPYFIGILVIPASIFFFGFYLKQWNAYAFTNKRIIIYRGWIATSEISIDYDKITEIIVEEPVWEKLFTHTGRLIINTAGVGSPELKQEQRLEHIDNPYEIKKKLDDIRG